MKKKSKTEKAELNPCYPEEFSPSIQPAQRFTAKNNRPAYDVVLLFFFALLPIPFAFFYAVFIGPFLRDSTVRAILYAPFIEEFFKIIGIFIFILLHSKKINSSVQIVWASFIAAFSFAIVENILYAYFRLAKVNSQLFIEVMTFRWFFLTLIHVLCTLIASMGMIYLWKCKQAEKKPSIIKPLLYFMIAVFIHGLYNTLVLIL
jgi:RsiW-degrading membrane proteinase PrsW (M82 family)